MRPQARALMAPTSGAHSLRPKARPQEQPWRGGSCSWVQPLLLLRYLSPGATAGWDATIWVSTLGVWAFTLTLGLAAAPRRGVLWWTVPLAVSFLARTCARPTLHARRSGRCDK